MRILRLVVCFLLLASGTVAAQGLEYRVRMHMTMPGMPDGMPTPETTMMMQGGKIRVDNSTHGFQMSLIIDGKRMYFLNHTEKSYREEVPLEKLVGKDAARDTAALRAMGLTPEIVPTTDKRTILGYATERYIMVMRIPVPGEPGTVMVSVNESWIATDPHLKEAFNTSIEAAERALGPAAGEMKALMPPGAQGVPLESNIVMLRRPASDKVDAIAVLKDANLAGLMTRVRMETVAVNVRNIPDSVFTVPAGYQKQN